MQARLRHYHAIQTSRETVRLVLRYIDPDGVDARRRRRLQQRRYFSKGPNYIFHIDRWDKLKYFGLPVHGCIDGFSRNIMWLETGSTNNYPFHVCTYLCSLVRQLSGVPNIIRSDRGNENVNIEMVQRLLRNDEQPCFLYGKSSANQRIEAWWSKFPQMGMEAWIEHFKSLQNVGIIDCSLVLHVKLISEPHQALYRQVENQISCTTSHNSMSRHPI